MNPRIALFTVMACWLILFIVSCAATPAGQTGKKALPVKVLISGSQCLPAPETWAATWISSPDQLKIIISRCQANTIGISLRQIPEMDFEKFGLLAVEMGRQSSAGYGFNTETVTAYMENGTATVELEYYLPAPGALTAQIITGPWVLIRLPTGPYKNIRVTDQKGRILTRIDLEEY